MMTMVGTAINPRFLTTAGTDLDPQRHFIPRQAQATSDIYFVRTQDSQRVDV